MDSNSRTFFRQMVLMSVTIAPIRFFCLFFLLGIAGVLSWIGLLGISETDLVTKPLGGWRRRLQRFIYKMGRWGFFCIGIHKLKITGEKVNCISNTYKHIYIFTHTFVVSNTKKVCCELCQANSMLYVCCSFVCVHYIKFEMNLVR